MRILLPLFFVAGIWAQDKPQAVWQGQVDGVAVLYLRGNRLNVKITDGGPIEQQQFHFYHPLPETQQEVRLRVIEARGYVHILDQPRIENQCTLAVEIEDRQAGSSHYSIALYWDATPALFETARGSAHTETIAWTGRVDEDALVTCREKTCTSTMTRGAPVASERFKMTRPLPDRAVEVTLSEKSGRGDIRLIEQPSERNQYSARVQIRDAEPGPSEYSFKLTWERPNGKAAPPPVPAGRGLTWSGSVTGRVRVMVQGGAAFSEPVDGGAVSNQRADFLRPLPARSDLVPIIHVLSGRGTVQAVETPSRANNYQFVFEIADPGPGAGAYEIELDW